VWTILWCMCSVHCSYDYNNTKFKEKLVKVYQPFTKTLDDVQCTGCLSEEVVFEYCQTCPIKSCVKEKEIEGCYQCEEWPCRIIKRFSIPIGKRVIMRSIPEWRELGTEKWVRKEENMYHCPECNNPLFRGAKRCNKCSNSVDVD